MVDFSRMSDQELNQFIQQRQSALQAPKNNIDYSRMDDNELDNFIQQRKKALQPQEELPQEITEAPKVPRTKPISGSLITNIGNALPEVGHAIQGGLQGLLAGSLPKVQGALAASITPLIPDKYLEPELKGENYTPKSWNERRKIAQDLGRKIDIEAQEKSPWSYGAGNIAGGIVSPLGKVSKAKGVAGAIKNSTAYGGAYGAGTTDTSLSDSIISGVLGGGTGALMGAAGHTIGKHIIDPFIRKVKGLFGNKPEIPNKQMEALLKSAERDNIPLTEAQVTRDMNKAWQEHSAKLGNRGAIEKQQYETALSNATEGLKGKLHNIEKDVSGGLSFVEKGTHAKEAVDKKIVEPIIKEKKLITEAYNKAVDNAGEFKKEELLELPKALKQSLRKTVINSPVARDEIIFLNNIIKDSKHNNNITVYNELESWRQGISSKKYEAKKKGDYTDAKSFDSLINGYDKWIDDFIEKSIDPFNKDAHHHFKIARAKNAALMKRYKSEHKSEVGKKFLEEVVDDAIHGAPLDNENLVNRVFGSSKTGFRKESAAILKEITKFSPSAKDLLKLEATRRITDPLLQGQALTFSTNVDALIKNQPTLMKSLYTEKQIKALLEAAELGKAIHIQPRSALQPSGTALGLMSDEASIISKIKNLPGLLPIVNTFRPTAINTHPDRIRETILKRAYSAKDTPLHIKASAQKATTSIMDSIIDNKGDLEKRNKKKRGGQIPYRVMTKHESLLDLLKRPI